MTTLTVDLGERSYPIYIGNSLLGDKELLKPYIPGNSALIVTNETVAPLYLDKTQAMLSGLRHEAVILPDGEKYKNLEVLNQIYDSLLRNRFDRNTTVIALGGGVVGDMAGYAAASYQRGVNYIQVPTTLLSQVDSSVGGKTGVNHPLGKNMIGAFYQPQCVVADIATLATLDDRQLSAGLAEVIKYGLICDEPFYRWLQEQMPRLLAREEAPLAEAIERSCMNKARVVAEDEREAGLRAILNLGHTFGHAIETHQGYGQWLHGEAVAAGMLLALRMSAARGWIDEREVDAFRDLLSAVQLPMDPPVDMTPDIFLDHMGRDKKVIDGRLRLVLLRRMGEAVIVDDASEAELSELLLAT